MSVIDIAKSHFENIGVQSMEVSEWKDENGKPVILYWNPITLLEKNRLLKKSDNLNDIAILADVLVMKALDKDGKKVFKLEDKKKIKFTPEIKNLLTVADRLKITLSELLKMEVWEYNHWVSYFMIENEEHKEAINKSKYK